MTWRRRGFFCLKVAACYFKLAIANTPEDELAATLWNDTHELFEYNFEDFGFDFLDLPSPAPTHKRKLIDDESYFVPNRHSHNCDQDGEMLQ
ncbi:hypothetical protein PtA15_8A458 [Puccinia triticina]|uniref:Uncharacterized protein n=1 Tax=Puccinia triticina TaxID=208348 RepID=A0ABY7CQL6_9BASI|nr:uncharacterized protein PtA15_8A458 [Puccinia triticina]WAQ87554.1 hypothetical protein PtA15_8A458 [Puccinia triticina]WAR57403.1 hypothetical protein PtB15_8B450 [Puccinia triticina]